jgi:hypothetical protein
MDKLDIAEKNWKQGDTRSAEFLLIQVVRHLAIEHDTRVVHSHDEEEVPA